MEVGDPFFSDDDDSVGSNRGRNDDVPREDEEDEDEDQRGLDNENNAAVEDEDQNAGAANLQRQPVRNPRQAPPRRHNQRPAQPLLENIRPPRRQRRDGNNQRRDGNNPNLLTIRQEAFLPPTYDLTNGEPMQLNRLTFNASAFAVINHTSQLTGGVNIDEELAALQIELDIDLNLQRPITIDNISSLATKGQNYPGQSDNILVGMILSMRMRSSVELQRYSNRNVGQRKQTFQNMRIFHILDLNGNQGNNVFAVIVDQSNTTIYENDVQVRDDGHFRCGAFVVLRQPSIRNQMNNGTLVVEQHQSVILVQPTMKLPDVLPDLNSSRQCGSILNGCTLEYVTAHYPHCPCSGYMCDYQSFAHAYGRAPTMVCACVRGDGMGGTAIASLNVKVHHPLLTSPISVEGFASKWFHENILTSGGVIRLTPAQYTRRGQYIENRIRAILAYINRNGGWTIYGWQKVALVDDLAAQGQQQNGAGGNNENQVLSSNANFHLVRCQPTEPTQVDRDILSRIQIDLTEL